ncbi:MAG: hypothetical protein HQ527_04630 [Cyanobacteria bacterium]|nr:hypothetical protein [Cyanobacteria bacterium bin.51]
MLPFAPVPLVVVRLMAALLTACAVSGSVPADLGSLLRVGQPIVEADRDLRAKGWSPAPERRPDALDRERAGNDLASLSACSGGAWGYCRYDYRRYGHEDSRDGHGPDGHRRQSQLVVITSTAGPELDTRPKQTTPPLLPEGTAMVVRWSDEGPQGGRWGLCQQAVDQQLLPCEGP